MKNGQPRPRSSHPAELRRSGKFVNINKIFELIDISPNPAQSGARAGRKGGEALLGHFSFNIPARGESEKAAGAKPALAASSIWRSLLCLFPAIISL